MLVVVTALMVRRMWSAVRTVQMRDGAEIAVIGTYIPARGFI